MDDFSAWREYCEFISQPLHCWVSDGKGTKPINPALITLRTTLE